MTPPADPPFTEDQILSVALRFAADAGEDRPRLIQHVSGPHDLAVKVGSFGNKVYDQTRCYLIVMRGSFVLNVSRPPTTDAPAGTVLTLYINADTGALMGCGVGERYPDLEELGPVTTDLRR